MGVYVSVYHRNNAYTLPNPWPTQSSSSIIQCGVGGCCRLHGHGAIIGKVVGTGMAVEQWDCRGLWWLVKGWWRRCDKGGMTQV